MKKALFICSIALLSTNAHAKYYIGLGEAFFCSSAEDLARAEVVGQIEAEKLEVESVNCERLNPYPSTYCRVKCIATAK